MKSTIITAAGFFSLALAMILWAPRSAIGHPTEQATDPSAKFAGRTSEVCVFSSSPGLVPPLGFTNRKWIELQNLGPNVIYCTVDAQPPLGTGALGRRIAAAGGTWSLKVGRGISLNCIAATADQTSPACTQVTELR